MSQTIPMLQNHGQIVRMQLPEGWTEREVLLEEFDQRSLLEFVPPEDPAVRLSFYYRGLPVSDGSGKVFKSLLEAPMGPLSAEALESIAEILANLSLPEAFTIDDAVTVDLAGRNVLAVTGIWIVSGEQTWALFIDADGTGTVVQEIHFVAPADKYRKYEGQITQSIASLQWRPKSTR